ncbi:ATP-binding protein [Streptomyces sp. NBC_01242]|uniref:ATP-binding protein n=1 Tax=Streptomyces sp. NBC_01242 TaxID=2903795 RepID=UPI002250B7C0|nr:ATP-binding protein [Streptomyces sp. NBC_01242]MCX4799645.1 ATP-binding protein [Streptomyces sp. NBC_01242]
MADSIPAAREHFAKAAISGGLDPAMTETAILCLSELATNCVVHARRRFIVVVSVRGMRQRSVRLAVHDTHRTRPAFPPKDAALDVLGGLDLDATGGRGMAMVAMMADRTGVEPDCNGKTVWCELRLSRPDVGGGPVSTEGGVTVTR